MSVLTEYLNLRFERECLENLQVIIKRIMDGVNLKDSYKDLKLLNSILTLSKNAEIKSVAQQQKIKYVQEVRLKINTLLLAELSSSNFDLQHIVDYLVKLSKEDSEFVTDIDSMKLVVIQKVRDRVNGYLDKSITTGLKDFIKRTDKLSVTFTELKPLVVHLKNYMFAVNTQKIIELENENNKYKYLLDKLNLIQCTDDIQEETDDEKKEAMEMLEAIPNKEEYLQEYFDTLIEKLLNVETYDSVIEEFLDNSEMLDFIKELIIEDYIKPNNEQIRLLKI